MCSSYRPNVGKKLKLSNYQTYRTSYCFACAVRHFQREPNYAFEWQVVPVTDIFTDVIRINTIQRLPTGKLGTFHGLEPVFHQNVLAEGVCLGSGARS